jgi:DNA-binding FrmR family transcriptional regulator
MDTKSRVNRIIGQLRGIERMVDNDRSCEEVLQQITAVKKAIDAISRELVVQALSHKKTDAERKHIEQVIVRVLGS